MEYESSVVPIQPNGPKPPFFCIHAAGGNVLSYRDLARHLEPNQPLYGIQARRIGGEQVAHSDVKDMAAYYIKEMRTVQPKGPYYIGGASFGGMVAFEMAQQFKAQGEDVAFLAFFDTRAPGYPRYLPGTTLFKSKVLNLVRKLELHWDKLVLLKTGTRRNYVAERIRKLKHRLWRAKRKYGDVARTGGLIRAVRVWRDGLLGRSTLDLYAAPGVVPGDYRKTEGNIRRAFSNYKPGFYSGTVTLFRASKQEMGIYHDPTLGWGQLINELKIHEVQGQHWSIIEEPHVQFLAEKLQSALSIAQKGMDCGTEKREQDAPDLAFSFERS